jgi:hypothetical protein
MRSRSRGWSSCLLIPASRAGYSDRLLEQQRWAAFLAATVEWLCWQEKLPFPTWTSKQEYLLRDPWFLYPGWRLRAWQLATMQAPYKMRNIFGGDHMLNRV